MNSHCLSQATQLPAKYLLQSALFLNLPKRKQWLQEQMLIYQTHRLLLGKWLFLKLLMLRAAFEKLRSARKPSLWFGLSAALWFVFQAPVLRGNHLHSDSVLPHHTTESWLVLEQAMTTESQLITHNLRCYSLLKPIGCYPRTKTAGKAHQKFLLILRNSLILTAPLRNGWIPLGLMGLVQ